MLQFTAGVSPSYAKGPLAVWQRRTKSEAKDVSDWTWDKLWEAACWEATAQECRDPKLGEFYLRRALKLFKLWIAGQA